MAALPVDPSVLLAAIVESSDDAIVSKDLNGTITTWNRAAERMFGYTAEEAIGRSVRMIVPQDRQSEEDEVLRRIRAGLGVDHYSTIRVRKDGTLIDISLTVSPVRSPDGTIVGASKIARDITAKRRSEEALNRSQQMQEELHRRLLLLTAASGSILGSPHVDDVLAAAIRLAADLIAADGYAVWRLAPDTGIWSVGSYTGVSPEFAAAIVNAQPDPGAPPLVLSEPLVANDVSQVPMLDNRRAAYEREHIKSMLVVPLTIRDVFSGTLVFYHRQPHVFSEVEVHVGRALGYLTSGAMTMAELYDEQERGHLKTAFLAKAGSVLASSLDYQTTLKKAAALAVPHVADWCVVDLANDDGKIERLGMAHADPARVELGKRFLERYPEDPSSPYSVHSVIRTGRSVIVERLTDEMITGGALSDDHRLAILELGITSFMCVPLSSRGRTLGAITFASSKAERLYGDSDLRFAEDFASRAALAVENAKAYEEARRANRVKDDFLATLSHELRTPLNAILGYARMLRSGVLEGEKHARGLEVVERSASALTQIVEDVLDVSRIVSGKIRLNVQPVELAVVVNDAIGTVLPAADARGIRVNPQIDPSVGAVSGDADRLQQIVWNLLSNAVKFTPRGGRVDVGVEAVGSDAVITVRDTGIGFDAAFAPHVFERFRQAHGGLDREHGGLGLGLAIARQLVELHGGTISAASEGKDKGATFVVRLPLLRAREEAVRMEEAHSVGTMATSARSESLGGIHVLAVDDDRDALSLVREILEAAGARVTAIESAAAALDVIVALKPDVIVADIGMPNIDGFEMISRIRRLVDSAASRTPAAALTAYARTEDRARALRDGFQLHLAKPIDPARLVSAVAALASGAAPTTP